MKIKFLQVEIHADDMASNEVELHIKKQAYTNVYKISNVEVEPGKFIFEVETLSHYNPKEVGQKQKMGRLTLLLFMSNLMMSHSCVYGAFDPKNSPK